MQVKFGQKNPWPEYNTFVESKVTQGSIRGQSVFEYANELINLQNATILQLK